MNLLKFLTQIRNTRETGRRSKEGTFATERREHPRYKLELPIDYSVMDGQERWGTAADASEGGLLVYLCVFLSIPDTRSGRFRTPIPFDSGQSFQSIPDTL